MNSNQRVIIFTSCGYLLTSVISIVVGAFFTFFLRYKLLKLIPLLLLLSFLTEVIVMSCLRHVICNFRALTAAVMLPFLRYGFERTTWHEVAALVMCETTHPLSTLYIAVYYIRGDEDASLGGRIFHHDVRCIITKFTCV